ncbi:PREDICTED: uncharacterized protein LOC108358467 [Rhagoletis zephyria]|uniref:uncharacterized protein LOC108358467 n=1 Tax=Rhagoletis zephyria TaxID=28612 RepID=UPI0008116F89|nr:PREDICTED: uncharacterized protein LOC108358467 [Rhagoletis zephyria]
MKLLFFLVCRYVACAFLAFHNFLLLHTYNINAINNAYILTCIYSTVTLGDFHQNPNPTQQIKAQQNRRQNSDPFERDPFKIQSYNFRYAERPSHPLANLGNSRAHPSSYQPQQAHKGFETFFYNYDFTPSVHDKENPPTNKFRQFRRRKFLLDHQQQNPTTASMLAQATHSRETSSMLSYPNRYEQLHPITNDTTGCYARIGTEASQTAFATSTAAAVAAAGNPAGGSGRVSISGSGYSERVRGAADHGGRHYQTLGSATRTSSIGTTAGLRSGAREYGSTSAHMSANKYGRSNGNREYLRALATAHISASPTNQSNYSGRERCSRRTSLDNGRRLRAEPLGGCSGHSFGRAHGSAKVDEFRELSGSRASPSKYARQPLQSVHSASPNRVTATVEKTEGACSGCQININIKGLDSTQLGDNVVIKIESDKITPTKMTSKIEQNTAAGNTLNTIYNNTDNVPRNDIAFANLVEIKRNSETNQNLDIKPKMSAHNQTPQAVCNSSSAFFVIDKRLSKFAMTSADERAQRKDMSRSSLHSRVPVTPSTTRAMGFNSSATLVRGSNSSEAINRSASNVSEERMPSMVPWCLGTTIRRGFSQDDNVTTSLHAHASNLLKHSHPPYDATLSDVHKKRRHAVLAAYKPFSLQRKAENFGSGVGGADKASSTAMWMEKRRKSAGAPVASWNADNVQQRRSQHSLRSSKESKSTLNPHSNSQLEVGRSPTMIMRRSHSSIRPGQLAQHAVTDSQSHVTTPLNVNINVFAEKLKLLRV